MSARRAGTLAMLATLAGTMASSLPSMTTFGAAPAATTWAEEPAAFAGISLGQRFPAAGDIADCPLFEPFRRENLPDELCVDTSKGVSAEAIALKYVPLGRAAGDGSVELRDGLVHAIRVSFDSRQYAYAKAQLIERFGAPHTRTAEEPGETLGWSGSKVAMTLREGGGAHGRALLEIRALPATTPR